MKNKKLLIILIIIITILIISIGGFAFLFFCTDTFLSPKQLFFKYLAEPVQTSEKFDYDKLLSNFKSISEKSKISDGEISFELNTNIAEAEDLSKLLNSLKFNYNIRQIPKDNKLYYSFGASYDNKQITKLESLESNDSYGIKCTDLYDKYVYIENNNLKALAKKFKINPSAVPDSISKMNVYDLINIDKETRNKIKKQYLDVINKELDDKKFKKSKNVITSVNGENLKTTSYSLELSEAEILNLTISILETLKNDDTTLNLIIEKENILLGSTASNLSDSSSDDISTSMLSKQDLQDAIQEYIDSFSSLKEDAEKNSSTNKIKITVYKYKKHTAKIDFELSDKDDYLLLSVEITKSNDSNNKITFNVDKQQLLEINYQKTTEGKSQQKITGTATLKKDFSTFTADFNFEKNRDSTKSNIKVKLPVENVLSINDYFDEDIVVEVNSEFSGNLGTGINTQLEYITVTSGSNLIKLTHKNDINYTDNISIEDLNTENGFCLNTTPAKEIEKEFSTILRKFYEVFPEKMKILNMDVPSDIPRYTSTTNNNVSNTNTDNLDNTINNNAENNNLLTNDNMVNSNNNNSSADSSSSNTSTILNNTNNSDNSNTPSDNDSDNSISNLIFNDSDIVLNN